MKSVDIYNCLESLNIYNNIDLNINNITIDTRKVKDRDCYIGIKGENNDGNLFYMEAFKKGASIVILDNYTINDKDLKYLKENNKSIVLVKDSVIALGTLAKYKRSLFIFYFN